MKIYLYVHVLYLTVFLQLNQNIFDFTKNEEIRHSGLYNNHKLP